MKDKTKCTLTDVELLEACHKAITEMCKNQKWQMTVPVDMNRDSDMLLAELCTRYENACSNPQLGNATTAQLFEELKARVEVGIPDHKADILRSINRAKDWFTGEELRYRPHEPLTMRSGTLDGPPIAEGRTVGQEETDCEPL